MVCLVCLVFWLNETNRMNQIHQINKTNQINQMNQINPSRMSRTSLVKETMVAGTALFSLLTPRLEISTSGLEMVSENVFSPLANCSITRCMVKQ